ncbi:hypothetical protein M3J09_006887 [Ascochyta lentis]
MQRVSVRNPKTRALLFVDCLTCRGSDASSRPAVARAETLKARMPSIQVCGTQS